MQLQPIGSLQEVTPLEIELAKEISKYYNDPLGFVRFVFRWGHGELIDHTGPDEWQTTFLTKVKDELEKRDKDVNIDTALRIAVASGHGVGKTAMVAWIILWFISTRPKCQIVVTANTQSQLSTKTWRELNVWLRHSINRHWWTWTATKLYHTLYPEIWFAAAIPWSKDNAEAFAGTHAANVLILFDEASAIDEVIWQVIEGALTTKGSMFFCFGNPTRSNGNFHDAFHAMKHRWITYQVDSRKAKMANKSQLDEWIADYGEDSDFVRVRIRGEFPRQSATQFIPSDVVYEAMKRTAKEGDYSHHPIIIGVDVSRYGNDQTIIVKRQGYKVFPCQKYRLLDNMEVAGKVVEVFRGLPTGRAMICVDGVGVGAGVVDRLKQLGLPVIDVQSAEKPIDTRTYANKRAENWGRMKDWLIAGGILPNDPDLEKQLTGLEYGLNKRLQILLQSKEDIRRHGGTSPDIADAIAFTFSYDEHKMFETHARARFIKRPTWI
jgi:hypothetical protein